MVNHTEGMIRWGTSSWIKSEHDKLRDVHSILEDFSFVMDAFLDSNSVTSGSGEVNSSQHVSMSEHPLPDQHGIASTSINTWYKHRINTLPPSLRSKWHIVISLSLWEPHQ